MEQEHFNSDFKELYDRYIRLERQESDRIYSEVDPKFVRPARRFRLWHYPVAAAILILAAGMWALRSDLGTRQTKPEYTETKVRQSLGEAVRALTLCSQTINEEFGQVENLGAMTEAISPASEEQPCHQQTDFKTTNK